jgi:hypothetical protein
MGGSQLVAKQVQKEFDYKIEKIIKCLLQVRIMGKFFNGFEVRYVPWFNNQDTNHLAWIASSRAPTPPNVIVEKLFKHSVKAAESSEATAGQDLMVIDESKQKPVYDWMHSIKIFLEKSLHHMTTLMLSTLLKSLSSIT